MEFGVEIGEGRRVVRVPRRVFGRLLSKRFTPERCIEAYFLQRTRFDSIAERKLRQLTGRERGDQRRDLREGPEPTFHRPPIAGGGPKAAIDRDVSQEPR